MIGVRVTVRVRVRVRLRSGAGSEFQSLCGACNNHGTRLGLGLGLALHMNELSEKFPAFFVEEMGCIGVRGYGLGSRSGLQFLCGSCHRHGNRLKLGSGLELGV